MEAIVEQWMQLLNKRRNELVHSIDAIRMMLCLLFRLVWQMRMLRRQVTNKMLNTAYVVVYHAV